MTTPPSDLDTAALDRLQQWGGPKLLTQMVRLFLDNSPTRIEQIREGIRSETAEDAERGAHSLKSSAANVGAMAVSGLAAVMEDLASRGELAAVEALRPDLEAAMERAREHLEGFLDQINETS